MKAIFKINVLDPKTEKEVLVTISGSSPQDFEIIKGGSDMVTPEFLQTYYIDELNSLFILALGLDY